MREFTVPVIDFLHSHEVHTVAFEDDIEAWGTKFNVRLGINKSGECFIGLYEQPAGLRKKYAESGFQMMEIGGLPNEL
jgi:hypothetical protein